MAKDIHKKIFLLGFCWICSWLDGKEESKEESKTEDKEQSTKMKEKHRKYFLWITLYSCLLIPLYLYTSNTFDKTDRQKKKEKTSYVPKTLHNQRVHTKYFMLPHKNVFADFCCINNLAQKSCIFISLC